MNTAHFECKWVSRKKVVDSEIECIERRKVQGKRACA